MSNRVLTSLTAALVLLAIPVVRSAGQQSPPVQQPTPDLIPRDLVMALISYGPGMSGGDLRVGRAPDNIPPELIPPGAEVLGGMTQFENSVTILALPAPPDSASDILTAHLKAAGWAQPASVASAPVPRGGFVDSQGGMSSGMPNGVLCKGDAFVNVFTSYRRSGGSVVKLMYNSTARYSPCRPPEARMTSPFGDAPVPTLYSPEGALTTGGRGMSHSEDQVEMTTRLSTRMKAVEITKHYAAQMLKEGWTPLAAGDSEFFAGQMFRKVDDKGRTWHATLLTVARPDRSDRDISLRVSRR